MVVITHPHFFHGPLGDLDFPGGSDGKASAYNVGDPASIPGLGRSFGEGNGQPTRVLLPVKSHGWRNLVGYSPWGCKESDMTERLHFTSLLGYLKKNGCKRTYLVAYI